MSGSVVRAYSSTSIPFPTPSPAASASSTCGSMPTPATTTCVVMVLPWRVRRTINPAWSSNDMAGPSAGREQQPAVLVGHPAVVPDRMVLGIQLDHLAAQRQLDAVLLVEGRFVNRELVLGGFPEPQTLGEWRAVVGRVILARDHEHRAVGV